MNRIGQGLEHRHQMVGTSAWRRPMSIPGNTQAVADSKDTHCDLQSCIERCRHLPPHPPGCRHGPSDSRRYPDC